MSGTTARIVRPGASLTTAQTTAGATGVAALDASNVLRGLDGNPIPRGDRSLVTVTTTGNYTLTTAATTRITLDANRQISMPASPGAVSAGICVILNCAGFTPTWSGVTWLTFGGTAPTLNTVAGKENVLTFVWDSTPGLWLGFLAGSET